jgi:hypothetical protein
MSSGTATCFEKTICLIALVFGGAWGVPSIVFSQAYKSEVGYTDLIAEKGAGLEDGTGIVVMQPEGDSGGNYLPDATNSEFSGKSFTDGTGSSSGSNSHATTVGINFYGNTSSMTPGIDNITGYDALDYLVRVLGFSSGGDPLTQGYDVGNHSYTGSGLSMDATIDFGRRFDYVINRDNTLMVVAAQNGANNPTPDFFATSYNAITVGVTDGDHSRGPTDKYGPGRIKPDIVAPSLETSFATPIVGSAAALLRQAGAGTNAIENEVLKSMLFAGATKEEFAEWDRTTTRPVDDVYGFGELNIYNSYHIFEGGEFAASTANPASEVGLLGWDYGDFDGTNDLFYDFEIVVGQTATELSAALVWNIDVIDGNASASVFDASTELANLDLELFDSTGTFMGSLLDASLSTVYNYEHIFFKDLGAGSYTFKISGDLAVDYGFSWRIQTVPEPNSVIVLGFGLAGLAARRRRV